MAGKYHKKQIIMNLEIQESLATLIMGLIIWGIINYIASDESDKKEDRQSGCLLVIIIAIIGAVIVYFT